MKQSKAIILTALAVMSFAACSKKDSGNPAQTNPTPTKTPKELIVASWKITSITAQRPVNVIPGRGPSTDMMEPCAADDILTFKSDGTGTVDHGQMTCDSGETRYGSFTWNLDNYPNLMLTAGTQTATMVLTELNDKDFKMKDYFELSDSTQYSITVYTRQ